MFVNDGSTDNSLKMLKKISEKDKKVKAISYFPNRGMGHAHRTIYNNSAGDIIIIMDADLSTPADIMFPLIKTLNKENLDMVIASRYAGTKADVPFFRSLPSWVYYFANKILFKFKVRDSQSGFMAFRSSAIKSLNLTSNKFEIHVELLAKMQRKGYKIKEIPAEYVQRVEGSKFNVLTDGPKTLLSTFKIWWNLKKIKKKNES